MPTHNRRSLRTVTAPAGEAVSLSDIKHYLRVDGDEDDAMLTAFIETATESVKQFTRVALLTEVFELQMDGFPFDDDDALVRLGSGVHEGHRASITGNIGEIDLPFAPLQSLDSITTYNRANVATVFASAAYEADFYGARIYLNDGYSWPSDLRLRDAVHIRYTAGYGAGSIPAPLVQAIRQHVESMYECRGGCDLPDGCKVLATPYRRFDQLGWF